MSRLDKLEKRLKDATPGPWNRPLNTRYKSTVTALLPDDEEGHWLDRKDPEGNPERVVVVSCPSWSNGKHSYKRSGRDLELIARAPSDLTDFLQLARTLEQLHRPVHPDWVRPGDQVCEECTDAASYAAGGSGVSWPCRTAQALQTFEESDEQA